MCMCFISLLKLLYIVEFQQENNLQHYTELNEFLSITCLKTEQHIERYLNSNILKHMCFRHCHDADRENTPDEKPIKVNSAS